jgi:hypothetical protein
MAVTINITVDPSVQEQYRQQNAVDPDRREFLPQQRKLAIVACRQL